ncbi:MAG: dienelactone hydrolase family protein [Flavobacteriaceae bacterium]|nr:dienelactone hydrolase family protein [Flavobacteriaceae bacterium]
MKKLLSISILYMLIFSSSTAFGQEIKPEKISFSSLDGLKISANLFHQNNNFPVILLCHQARYNKAEYDEIAVELYKKGFNLIAIDQRSGGTLFDKENETFVEAEKLGKPTTYLDAEQDIEAAINFAYRKYNQKIILWGSSYSSTLSLYFASSNDKIKAVIAFSPGDYFAEQKGSLKNKLDGFSKPMFATSSSEEAPELTDLLSKIEENKNQIQFIPVEKGKHGSKALWKDNSDNEEYWKALNSFLDVLKKKD